jgi:hypothetical protein
MKQKKLLPFVKRFKQQIKIMDMIWKNSSEKPITNGPKNRSTREYKPIRGPEISDIVKHRPYPVPRA